jgi:hypothetical protein
MKLSVKEPFDSYDRGDVISEPAAVESALASHPNYVTRVAEAEPVRPPPLPESAPSSGHPEA